MSACVRRRPVISRFWSYPPGGFPFVFFGLSLLSPPGGGGRARSTFPLLTPPVVDTRLHAFLLWVSVPFFWLGGRRPPSCRIVTWLAGQQVRRRFVFSASAFSGGRFASPALWCCYAGILRVARNCTPLLGLFPWLFSLASVVARRPHRRLNCEACLLPH